MPINIALALDGVDFNKVNITLVDGLSIDKLKIRYNWIFNAIIDGAIIGEDSNGLVWYSGTWLNGEWYDGTWYSGDFVEGVWKNGSFYSYKLNKYDVVNGVFNIIDKNDSYSRMGNNDPVTKGGVVWENGNFYGGTFGLLDNVYWDNYDQQYNPANPEESNDITNNVMNTCVWRNGNFFNGIFNNSIWYDGNWYNGYMNNIQWINGKFYAGEFNGHVWYDGVFLGGDFLSGRWYNGTFTMFDSTVKSRFGAKVNPQPSKTSKLYASSTADNNYPTVVYKGGDNGLSNIRLWNDSENTIKNKMMNPLTPTSATFSDIQSTLSEPNIITEMLTFKGFVFNIPEESTIDGIEVKLSLYNEGAINAGDYVRINYISVSDDVNLVGYENKASSTPSNLPLNTGSYTWNVTCGGASDTWGHVWDYAKINDTETFNLNLQLSLYKNSPATVSVNGVLAGVKVKVYYTYKKYQYDYNNCVWVNGTFNNGEFHSSLNTDAYGNSIVSENQNFSIWKNGTFNNGKWYGGKFLNGTWNSGDFYAGFFGSNGTQPIWNNGTFYNGFWVTGVFNGGEFHNGIAQSIIIKGGQIGD